MLYTKHPENLVFALAVSFFFFFSPFLSQSQTEEADAVFILKGNTRMQNGKGVEGVELELKKSGKSVQKLLSGKNGKYSLKMDISTLNKDNEYVLYISQAGMVPKSISINTYISKEEYAAKTFPSYLFELEIKMNATTSTDIIINKPSGRIHWDAEQHAFAFDQTFLVMKQDDTEKLLAEKKKREEEEAARKKAEEEAKLKTDAEAKALAAQKAKDDADRIAQKNRTAVKIEMKRKRMQDSLDSLALAHKGNAVVEIVKTVKPISAKDVDENAFDGTGAYSINIAKKSLKAAQEKMNREKAGNLSAKYETNNTLTSLLNMVDEYEKTIKSKVKSQQL